MDGAYTPSPETVEAFADSLDTADTVAVVAAPWSGRDALLDHAAGREGPTTRVQVEDASDEPPAMPEKGRLLVADCHRLLRRTVDGFDGVERFCRDIVAADATVVTAWNATAWAYLDAVAGVGSAFDAVVEVPPLDADQAEQLLHETTDTEDPEAELAAYAEYPPDSELTLDYARVRVQRLFRGTLVDHLEGLVDDAAGNPRTIRTLFECRTQRGVDGRPGSPDVDYDASYLLWLVLANEGLDIAALARRADQPVETPLASLARQGVVTVDDEHVTVPAEAFGDVRSHLDGRRLLW